MNIEASQEWQINVLSHKSYNAPIIEPEERGEGG